MCDEDVIGHSFGAAARGFENDATISATAHAGEYLG